MRKDQPSPNFYQRKGIQMWKTVIILLAEHLPLVTGKNKEGVFFSKTEEKKECLKKF